MSVEELASQAGIDPGYLAYFESSPDANLSGGTLLLIALALDTTPFELLGAAADRPPGQARAVPHAALNELTPEQCRTHLSVGGVGRIVFATARGPVALPGQLRVHRGPDRLQHRRPRRRRCSVPRRRSASRSTASTRP